MDQLIKSIFLASILVVGGCASVQKLPKKYWVFSSHESSRTELVYVAEHQSKLSVYTTIDSVNGYLLESTNAIKVPIGRNKFKITCSGKIE